MLEIGTFVKYLGVYTGRVIGFDGDIIVMKINPVYGIRDYHGSELHNIKILEKQDYEF